MKYLKTFDKKNEDVVLYKNSKFNITINNKNNIMTFNSHYRACSPIWGLAEEIRDHSKYLDDIELRNISITNEEKDFSMLSFDTKFHSNRMKYRSSNINDFISNKKTIIEKIPDKAYDELIKKYYPILEQIIIKSKTLGDIIDEFKIIYEQINHDLPLFIATSKYNI